MHCKLVINLVNNNSGSNKARSKDIERHIGRYRANTLTAGTFSNK